MTTQTPTLELSPHAHPENPRLTIILRTPYHRGFVEQLKESIPAAHRAYDPKTFAWWTDEAHRDAAIKLVLRYWPRIQIVGDGEEDYTLLRGGEIVSQPRLL